MQPGIFQHAMTGWMEAQAPWPDGVRAGCTLRTGGVSAPPWDGFNLGDHVGDRSADVQHNRHWLGQALGVQVPFLRQVHGQQVLELKEGAVAGGCADACWTEAPRMAALVLVADCLPVLMSSPDGRSVAAVHAGWRGLAGQGASGILEALTAQWPDLARHSDRSAVCVWLGPCIGPTAFEVGQDVVDAFMVSDPQASPCFTALTTGTGPAKYLANLAALARRRLARLGFTRIHGNDGTRPWCTYGQPSRFFSHRRDALRLGSTGRMAALIWREGS